MATRKTTPTRAIPKAKSTKAAKAKGKAKVLVRIGIVPPEATPGSKAQQLGERLNRVDTLPKARELARVPWFSQGRPFQAGYHLLTQGLRAHADHPELEMCNVPGAFVAEALRLLEQVAGYVLDGTRLDPGEMMLLAERPKAMIAFMKVTPSARISANAEDVLRVVFVC